MPSVLQRSSGFFADDIPRPTQGKIITTPQRDRFMHRATITPPNQAVQTDSDTMRGATRRKVVSGKPGPRVILPAILKGK
jgi:hypothetical protein